MATIAGVPFLVWVLLGLILSFFIDQIHERTNFKMPSRTWDYLLLLFNLLFLAWNASLMFFLNANAKELETGASEVTITDYLALSQFFAVLALVILGVIVGLIALSIWRSIKGKHKKTTLTTDTEIDTSSKPKVSMNLNINSADIPQMKAEHRKLLLEVIDKLQGSQPKSEEHREQKDESQGKAS